MPGAGAARPCRSIGTASEQGIGRLPLRVALLALGAVGLLTGLCGGLWRLGWAIPHGGRLAELHGPLMICGLFGTLISLERAVAIGRDWPFLAPILSALGTLALLSGLPSFVAISSYLLAAAVLAAASCAVMSRQPALFTGALLAGAVALLIGNGAWLAGATLPDVAGWWLAFLI